MPRRRRLVGAMGAAARLSGCLLVAGFILGLAVARLTIPFIFGGTP